MPAKRILHFRCSPPLVITLVLPLLQMTCWTFTQSGHAKIFKYSSRQGLAKPFDLNKRVNNGPQSKVVRCFEQYEILEPSYLEFQCSSMKHKAGTSLNHKNGYPSSKSGRPESGVTGQMFKTPGTRSTTGPKYEHVENAALGEPSTRPSPTSDHIQDNCVTALNSLQGK
jgi:hypothetical protein